MKRKGFTLVELLVVISIIALLLAILMPSLNKARAQGRSVVCMSNLKQLALCYNMYTNDNRGFFGGVDKMWPETLTPYFSKKVNLRCCPVAPGPRSQSEFESLANSGLLTGMPYGGPRYERKYWAWKDQYGSYGENVWIAHPNPSAPWPTTWGPEVNLWHKSDQSGANNIPLIADSYWMGGMPQYKDPCPTEPDTLGNNINNPKMLTSMQRFVSNRHGNKTNVAFMDWTVRSVGLKQLWKLKWHRNYDVYNAAPSSWPRWINKN